MADSAASVLGSLTVLEPIRHWLSTAWERVDTVDTTGSFVFIIVLLGCLYITKRLCGWCWTEAAEDDPQMKLLEAVEARACDNELLRERLLHQIYHGKLLRKEMRWLRECLHETRDRLEELRKQQNLFREERSQAEKLSELRAQERSSRQSPARSERPRPRSARPRPRPRRGRSSAGKKFPPEFYQDLQEERVAVVTLKPPSVPILDSEAESSKSGAVAQRPHTALGLYYC